MDQAEINNWKAIAESDLLPAKGNTENWFFLRARAIARSSGLTGGVSRSSVEVAATPIRSLMNTFSGGNQRCGAPALVHGRKSGLRQCITNRVFCHVTRCHVGEMQFQAVGHGYDVASRGFGLPCHAHQNTIQTRSEVSQLAALNCGDLVWFSQILLNNRWPTLISFAVVVLQAQLAPQCPNGPLQRC